MSFARELGPAVGGWAGECTMALPALSRAGGGDFLFSVFAGDHESFSLRVCVCVGGMGGAWPDEVQRGVELTPGSAALLDRFCVHGGCTVLYVCMYVMCCCMTNACDAGLACLGFPHTLSFPRAI